MKSCGGGANAVMADQNTAAEEGQHAAHLDRRGRRGYPRRACRAFARHRLSARGGAALDGGGDGHHAGNHLLVDLLEAEGAEAVVPDLIDFMQYCFYNQNFKVSHLGFKKSKALIGNLGIAAVEWLRSPATKAFAASRHFDPPAHIEDLAKMASEIVSIGNQTGEGWFLTGEMLELIHSGAGNIVCTQPFACLPNHVVGKGVIKELRRRHPESNIVAIDFDPGASEVNQLNRIKLMLSTAFKNLEKEK